MTRTREGAIYLSREELELIAKGLTAYKNEMKVDMRAGTDLEEYNRIEISHVDELANAMELDPEYFQQEKG